MAKCRGVSSVVQVLELGDSQGLRIPPPEIFPSAIIPVQPPPPPPAAPCTYDALGGVSLCFQCFGLRPSVLRFCG